MKDLAQLVPFVVIAALFWLLLIRPAQRRSREMQRTQGAADVGSEVMLTSGIFGSVVETGEGTLQVEIAPGTTIKVARAAVARVIVDSEAEEVDDQGDYDELDGELDDDWAEHEDADLHDTDAHEGDETVTESSVDSTGLDAPRRPEH